MLLIRLLTKSLWLSILGNSALFASPGPANILYRKIVNHPYGLSAQNIGVAGFNVLVCPLRENLPYLHRLGITSLPLLLALSYNYRRLQASWFRANRRPDKAVCIWRMHWPSAYRFTAICLAYATAGALFSISPNTERQAYLRRAQELVVLDSAANRLNVRRDEGLGSDRGPYVHFSNGRFRGVGPGGQSLRLCVQAPTPLVCAPNTGSDGLPIDFLEPALDANVLLAPHYEVGVLDFAGVQVVESVSPSHSHGSSSDSQKSHSRCSSSDL